MRILLPFVLPLLMAAAPRSPEAFLGHPVAADRELANWKTITAYLTELDAASDRLELQELGKTTEGRPFLVALVADAEGLRQKDSLRSELRRLYEVRSTDEAAARTIAATARPVLVFSLGLHSNEVGASQASMQMLYELATREDEPFVSIRRELFLLIVPCMNPDGLDIVVDWYRQTLGSEAEGTLPPWLYHPYAGHDNNRDAYFNNLGETALFSQLVYGDWLPQMIVDEHQMGNRGPRLFLPPFDDPISANVHPLVYSQLAAAGQQVVSDLTALGHEGIVTDSIFTAEWPGSVRSTGFWHNMLGVLSEVASADLATPLYFPPGSLSGAGRGLPVYERRGNFLAPWQGGWWRLGDIIQLELDLTWSILRWAVQHDADLLFNYWQMNRDAVRWGEEQAPFGFAFSPRQHDAGAAARLAELLQAGGVELEFLRGPLELESHVYPDGAYVVPTAQPFRPYVMEMLAVSPYPQVGDTGSGEVIRPYDVTAWHLPSLLGVSVQALQQLPSLPRLAVRRAEAPQAESSLRPEFLLSGRNNASYAAVNALLARGARIRRVTRSTEQTETGDFLVHAVGVTDGRDLVQQAGAASTDLDCDSCWEGAQELRSTRVGLFSPWGGSMDEGWTRLLLDRFGFEHERLRPEDLRDKREGDGATLAARLPVLVFPSIAATELRDGAQGLKASLHEPRWPARYQGGLAGGGVKERLLEYLRAGGRIVALDASSDWLIEELGLPVSVELQGLPLEEFYAPGTLLRARLEESHPLAFGSPDELAVYFAGGRAFKPLPWGQETRVVARYAEHDVRVAGFLVGEEKVAGRPCLLEIPVGEGRVVLFGFSPQFRAQPEASFKLLFAALLGAG